MKSGYHQPCRLKTVFCYLFSVKGRITIKVKGLYGGYCPPSRDGKQKTENRISRSGRTPAAAIGFPVLDMGVFRAMISFGS
jgi:hypothetical protein